jgi:hypothetical protein
MTVKVTTKEFANFVTWHASEMDASTLRWWAVRVYDVSNRRGYDAFQLAKAWEVSAYRVEDWITLGFYVLAGEPEMCLQDVDSLRALARNHNQLHTKWHRDVCPCARMTPSEFEQAINGMIL